MNISKSNSTELEPAAALDKMLVLSIRWGHSMDDGTTHGSWGGGGAHF